MLADRKSPVLIQYRAFSMICSELGSQMFVNLTSRQGLVLLVPRQPYLLAFSEV